jgi:hypothetical protein
LIRGQLKFLDCLLKGGDNGDDWPDGLRLTPVWITASPCHIRFALPLDRRVLTSYDLPLDSQNPPLVSILNGKLTVNRPYLRAKAH